MDARRSGTVTLVFTDIDGSTRLLDQLGDAYATLLSVAQRPYASTGLTVTSSVRGHHAR